MLTAVRPVIDGFVSTALTRCLGRRIGRSVLPVRRVVFDFMSLVASWAVAEILLIFGRLTVKA